MGQLELLQLLWPVVVLGLACPSTDSEPLVLNKLQIVLFTCSDTRICSVDHQSQASIFEQIIPQSEDELVRNLDAESHAMSLQSSATAPASMNSDTAIETGAALVTKKGVLSQLADDAKLTRNANTRYARIA
jgi:hypothetical protein